MSTLLHYELEDAAALAREYAQNLRHGRALVPQLVDAEPLSSARLLLVRRSDGAKLGIDARILMLLPDGPSRGTAVELHLDDAVRGRLERFVNGGEGDPVELEALPTFDDLPLLDELPPPSSEARDGSDGSESEAPPAFDSEAPDDEADDGEDPGDEAHGHEAKHFDPKIVRIRKLGVGERSRLARDGGLEDRVLLERAFGKIVWEDLVRNPQLTVPEVARIAAKGTAPRVMLEIIVDNSAWSKQSVVRRALLANPRVSTDGITKLLRGTPKNELKMIVAGAAYPAAVRSIAKKLLAE